MIRRESYINLFWISCGGRCTNHEQMISFFYLFQEDVACSTDLLDIVMLGL